MQRQIINGMIFLGGCAAGFVTGMLVTRKRMTEEKMEEVASIRQFYAEKIKPAEIKERPMETPLGKVETQDIENAKHFVNHIVENPDLKKIAKEIMKNEGYSSDPDRGPLDEEDDEEDEDDDEPEPLLERVSRNEEKNMEISYVIPPAECGECDYEVIELTYFADGVLVDDYDEVVDDPEDIVGPNALSSFGEYEEDTVYVRNDARRCDYCILKDLRNYSSLHGKKRR